MKKYLVKIARYISLLLLLAMAVLFIHSELSLHQGESEEFHAQHDFSNLVSKTLQPTHNCMPEFDGEAIALPITEDFHLQESANYRIEFPAALYPKDTSLILLFSTLLI